MTGEADERAYGTLDAVLVCVVRVGPWGPFLYTTARSEAPKALLRLHRCACYEFMGAALSSFMFLHATHEPPGELI